MTSMVCLYSHINSLVLFFRHQYIKASFKVPTAGWTLKHSCRDWKFSLSLCLSICCPGKNSDSHSAFEDLAHYEFLAQLKKASTSAALLDHLGHNGTAAVYHQDSRHEDLPPAIWSPGAQHSSPDGAGGLMFKVLWSLLARRKIKGIFFNIWFKLN